MTLLDPSTGHERNEDCEHPEYTVVVPTIGRPCLTRLLASLEASSGPDPLEVIVVDDRPRQAAAMPIDQCGLPLRVIPSGTAGRGRLGPAAARNAGWRAAHTPWVAFLDDDVVVGPDWRRLLAEDLSGLPTEAGGSQGRIVVPLPEHRRPTDWERNVAGLEEACWATADMAYRTHVLDEVGGFDETFRRAFREDSDLGLRVVQAGYLILRGERMVEHPVRPARRSVSIRLQAGNSDDVVMRFKHGPDWRRSSHAEPGRTARHVATVGSALAGAAAAVAGRRGLVVAGAAGWVAGTAELAWCRIAPGPRDRDEVAVLLATSVAIPVAATYYWCRGWWRVGRMAVARRRDRGSVPGLRFRYPTLRDRARFGPIPRRLRCDVGWRPQAVLLDRDGTLIEDTGYPSDPDAIRLMPGARIAVGRARQAGLATAVVTNQSGVGRGLIRRDEMESVNRRLDRLVGPVDVWSVCCHRPEDGCGCRKPAPGLIIDAAQRLDVKTSDCVVIGDIGVDVQAAAAAGARSILVPTPRTRAAEIRAARQVAPDLLSAIDLLLGGAMLMASTRPRALVARLDNIGDVLLAGPAVRAVARSVDVVFVCHPRSRPAVDLLPGVAGVVELRAGWIDSQPVPVTRPVVDVFVDAVRAAGADEAIILTSFHQSPLPLALLLRLAGVARISAISEDYPGTLLDVRHLVADDVHEVERSLSLAAAAGYPLDPADDRRLRVRPDYDVGTGPVSDLPDRFVVVHVGASVPARAWSADKTAGAVAALAAAGHSVVITGGPDDGPLGDWIAGAAHPRSAFSVAGRTTLGQLAAVLGRASVVVSGNTGPAHLAAAVGTPVVSVYAPTVPAVRWRPWMVAHVLLGRQDIPCAGCRARSCPVPGHPCIEEVELDDVVAAVDQLVVGVPAPGMAAVP